jgi:hypothetical protein
MMDKRQKMGRRRKLKNLKVEFVSFVDKAANKRTFYLTKSAEESKVEPNVELDVKLIFKADDEERKVYGIVYVPNEVDAQGDWIEDKALEKAAHNFMLDYQKMDTMHNMEEGAGKILESYIAPVDFDINGEHISKGTWVLVSQPNENVWNQIKRGELTGYSLFGTAEVEYEKPSFLDLLKSMLKNPKANPNPKEEKMDEQLQKALEEITQASEKLKNIETEINVLKEVITKRDEILNKFANLQIEDLNKSIENKVNTVVEPVVKKLDAIIEALSAPTTAKAETQKPEEVSTYKSMIL